MLGDGSTLDLAGPSLDRRVREILAALLDAADMAAPGLIEGFYPVGSVALADFRPHESDIDFMAVMAARPGAVVCDALHKAHVELQARQPRPHIEGVYVTWDDLRRDPDLAAPAPSWHAGRFQADSFALNPITWHTLAHHGIAVRGPAPVNLTIHTDPARLTAWTRHNLDVYWRPWHDRSARLFSRAGVAALGAWAPAWGVLSVSRLHYTLATGEITSKAGAGCYVLDTFPARWHRIIDECLRIRRGERGPSLYRNPLARRRDMLAYIDRVITAAKQLGAGTADGRTMPAAEA
jgi:hypothetical protein